VQKINSLRVSSAITDKRRTYLLDELEKKLTPILRENIVDRTENLAIWIGMGLDDLHWAFAVWFTRKSGAAQFAIDEEDGKETIECEFMGLGYSYALRVQELFSNSGEIDNQEYKHVTKEENLALVWD